jgi:hypothetical protein
LKVAKKALVHEWLVFAKSHRKTQGWSHVNSFDR